MSQENTPAAVTSGMSRIQYLLAKLAEEGNEVGQRALKAQIFGVDEIEPGQLLNNALRLQGEFLDLLGVWEMLADERLVPHLSGLLSDPLIQSIIERRKLKVEKYLAYARTLGTVV